MDISDLQQKSKQIRIEVIKMIARAGSGHPAGSLGIADILACLYFSVMKHDPDRPNWPERDRLLISNGHTVPVWYATLALAGYFPISELSTLRQINSRLQGHPVRGSVPGIENTSGPLGQGISVAVGVALAGQLKKKDYKVFCLISDGELNEGQTWEALLSAKRFMLNNIIVILDRNGIQLSGRTEEIMPLEPLEQKLSSFGWTVLQVDGHDHLQIVKTLTEIKENQKEPTVIVAKTIPGRGVSFMENEISWHGRAPSGREAARALRELEMS